ncbi:MAG: PaaI family thioesterase [Bacteroidetes bacterium]|nr:PaaI family thioesterase [Bacteroidota bacterium]MCY4206280.1 PaaI family thioesterase [Bacteroidota bacterium]
MCGRNNPHGLYMSFYDNGRDMVESRYRVSQSFEGYPGIVHGGVQAAILDEIIGRVSLIEDFHAFMMSVRLDVKYRHPVPVEEPLYIVGKREYLRGRYAQASGMIYLEDGTLATEASMKLIELPQEIRLAGDPAQIFGWRVDQ